MSSEIPYVFRLGFSSQVAGNLLGSNAWKKIFFSLRESSGKLNMYN